MKKQIALLVSALGSTAAWYILSNQEIRKELAASENPDMTGAILKKHFGRDKERLAGRVHDIMQSEEMQKGISTAKWLKEQGTEKAKIGLGGLIAKGKKAKKAIENIKKAT